MVTGRVVTVAARTPFDDRPADPATGLPVPFCLEDDEGVVDHAHVVRRRAIRCALSRICGFCGESLDWPVAFVGPDTEADADAFTFAPSHVGCAERALELYGTRGDGHLGQELAPAHWALVTTGGFDVERPASRRGDQRVRFHPNSVTGRRDVAASARD